MTDFYDVSAMEKIAINLFYGWGYNFYRKENQLRADDLVVRQRASLLLNTAKTVITQAESDYRKEFMPPPSRAKPLPDPEAIKNVTILAELSQSIGRLESAMRAAPAPENDRMTQRYRHEAETLVLLVKTDSILIGQADSLRAEVIGKDAAWLLENKDIIKTGITAMMGTLTQRMAIIT